MSYLFGQTWVWLLVSFVLGALVTWLVLRVVRKPRVQVGEERFTGAPAKPKTAEAASTTPVAADSALGTLDDSERTMALKSDADQPVAAVDDEEDVYIEDAPTGRIPVQSPVAPEGALSGSLADELAAEPTPMHATSAAATMDVSSDAGQPLWAAGAYAGSARPNADGSAPSPEFTVKGNEDSMLFHTEESAFYSVTTAEAWFRTSEDAETAGFRPWNHVADRTVPHGMVSQPPWENGAFPGSARPNADGSAPSPEYTVKGNADSMLFHTTESPYYARTKAEVWFKTAADAEHAGFSPWNRAKAAQGLVGESTWEAGAYPGSAKPMADGSAPSPEFTVKGNEDSMLFHTEESAFYPVTTAEVWFRTAEDAEAAGFRAWNRVGDQTVSQGLASQPASTPVAFPGSAKPMADGSAPSPEYTVKGNADSMLFHTTDSPYYARTKAEVWFKTATDAEQAGFSPWNRGKAAQGLAGESTWEAGAYPGSAKPMADGSAPAAEFTVKGNEDSMLFHTEESAFYPVTTAEVWFRTAEDAEAAGFRPWNRVGDRTVPSPAPSPEGTAAHGLVGQPIWEAGAYPGSAKPMADGSAPAAEFTVKGNEDSMLFHTKESAFYPVTTAEVWFRTADDAEAAGFRPWNRVGDRTAPQGLASQPTTERPTFPGSAKPNADGSAPSPEYTVKGNADSMLFHTTDSPYYTRTKAEVWFKTAADAEAAGFSPWGKGKARGLVSQPTWEAGSYPGSAKPAEDGSAPAAEFTVKGNEDSMLFHTEESAFYSVTKAEVWFRNAEDAEDAGFHAWNVVSSPKRDIPTQPVAAGRFGADSAAPRADGSAPSGDFTVKGNADSMLFHTTDSPYYTRTKAEVWFKTPADAEAAGFTAWNRRRAKS